MTLPPAGPSRGMWLVAALLLVAEFFVFDHAVSRYHAHVYPRWTDQTQYLTEAYTAAEAMQAHGLWAGLKTAFTKESLQGTMHDACAVVVFWITGSPSRSAALSLNMLAVLAWQAALLFVLPRVSGSRALGWMGFGLVLCLWAPWSVEPGSAVDFRLDHAAMCLLGVTSAVALLTDGFRSTRWSLAFGLVASFTLLERFLSGVYFAGIFLAAAAWIAGGDARALRLRNLLLAGLTMTVLAGPVFWLNRTSIYQYYWIGQVAGGAADVRASYFDLGASVQYLLVSLGELQLGAWFGWTVAVVSAVLLAAVMLARRAPAGRVNRDWLFFALAFLLVPAILLCLHRQKSAYVLGAIVPGLILLVAWAWGQAWRRIDPARPAGRRLVFAGAAGAVAAGLGLFLQRQLTPPFTAEFQADAGKINQISDHVFIASRQAGLMQPRIGIDALVDYFDGRTMSVVGYERHKVWLSFTTQFPTGILELPDDLVMTRLGECDFILLTDEWNEEGFYPYDRQMRRLYPAVKAWCEAHLRRIDSFPIFNRRMSLYQRREIP